MNDLTRDLRVGRRAFALGAGAVVLAGCAASSGAVSPRAVSTAASSDAADADDPISAIEARIGGRVGVFAFDGRTERTLAHRADERFAMCSTFKWALAAAVLARVDRDALRLEDAVPYTEADLLDYAPRTREHLAEGSMTVEALAAAAVVVSDNTAANLLLRLVDGPAGLTAFLRGIGDDTTRLDRDEPTLNTNLPGDPRDTTTPRAMVSTMQTLLLGDALKSDSRGLLVGWLRACETGSKRLRAGMPGGVVVGDKTGTGANGAANDVAIVTLAGAALSSSILIASYLDGSLAEPAALEAAHADVARAVASRLLAR